MNYIIDVASYIISLYGAYISIINGRLPYKKEILDIMFLINSFLKGISGFSDFSDDFNHDLAYVIFYSFFKNNDTDLNDIYNLNLNGKKVKLIK